MKIGIICPSEIALRRFMPALSKIEDIEFEGLGICAREDIYGYEQMSAEDLRNIIQEQKGKALQFVSQYGGKIYDGYSGVVTADEIDVVYIPLPPALHFYWAKKALENGKHVLVEKPSTTSYSESKCLVEIAKEKGLALHENYMFVFHKQLDDIERIAASGELGEVRLYRVSFGFPLRAVNDFRYKKALGGGALLDAGGYTLKYASKILGDTARLLYAQSNDKHGYEVDMYGSAALVNDKGTTVQVAFGMDNDYKCELELWGSQGTLRTGRVLTAPVGFIPTATIKKGNSEIQLELSEDDAFEKSIRYFLECVKDRNLREESYRSILRQAELVDDFQKLSQEVRDE